MSYERKTIEVEAIQLIKAIFDSENNRLADKGEWLIVDGNQQLYMKDEAFRKEFVRKPPEKEVVIQTQTISTPSYIYVNPCPPINPWKPCPDYWWQHGTGVWCDSTGYSINHSDSSAAICQ